MNTRDLIYQLKKPSESCPKICYVSDSFTKGCLTKDCRNCVFGIEYNGSNNVIARNIHWLDKVLSINE